MNRLHAGMLLVLGGAVHAANAQCPDGRPPESCRAAPAKARAIDVNRIAIVPARTSGADPALDHLREGLVDLLAPYFNGELGPQAVEPGEAIQAWKRAGAGPAPATPTAAQAVARRLGAGQVAYSVVGGTSRQVSVKTSILRVQDGKVMVPEVRVEGSVDSLATLARTLATQLLGQREGALRGRANTSGTADNEAARAYLDGMAAYRANRRAEALKQFRRAVQLDTAFTLAAYRLAICNAMYGPSAARQDSVIWQRLWVQRQRLSAEQWHLLEAVADANGILFRMAALPRLQRAIALLPNSVEAWDLHGDQFYHVGALLGYTDWAARAKSAFSHALALDSALAVNARRFLSEIAFMDGDRQAHARYAKAFPDVDVRYEAALLRGDPKAIHAARIDYARDIFPGVRYVALLDGRVGGWPPRELDSLVAELAAAATTEAMRQKVANSEAFAAANFGRPALALAALWRWRPSDSAAVYFQMLTMAQGDSEAMERSFAMVGRSARSLGAVGRTSREWACNAALARLRRGDTAGAPAVLAALRPAGGPTLDQVFRSIHTPAEGEAGREAMCSQVLHAALTAVTVGDATALQRADSLMRAMPMNCCDYWNYDLGLAFARRGNYVAAVAAVRRRWIFSSEPAPRLAIALLQEGRWAAKAGDTAAAINAYHHYLTWRENPEPPLMAQRDSARAELTGLEKAVARRTTRRKP